MSHSDPEKATYFTNLNKTCNTRCQLVPVCKQLLKCVQQIFTTANLFSFSHRETKV